MERYGFASSVYKPESDLKELKELSGELRSLSCEDTWAEQAKKEPENQRDAEKNHLQAA